MPMLHFVALSNFMSKRLSCNGNGTLWKFQQLPLQRLIDGLTVKNVHSKRMYGNYFKDLEVVFTSSNASSSFSSTSRCIAQYSYHHTQSMSKFNCFSTSSNHYSTLKEENNVSKDGKKEFISDRKYSENQKEIDEAFVEAFNKLQLDLTPEDRKREERITNLIYLLSFIIFSIGIVAIITSSAFLRFCINFFLTFLQKKNANLDNEWRIIQWKYAGANGCLICGSMQFSDVQLILEKNVKDVKGNLLRTDTQTINLDFLAMKLPLALILKSAFDKNYILSVPHLYMAQGSIELESQRFLKEIEPQRKNSKTLIFEDITFKDIRFTVRKLKNGYEYHTFRLIFNDLTNITHIRTRSLCFDLLYRIQSNGLIQSPEISNSKYLCKFNQETTDVDGSYLVHNIKLEEIPISTLPHLGYSNIVGSFSGNIATVEKEDILEMKIHLDVTLFNENSVEGQTLSQMLEKVKAPKKFTIKTGFTFSRNALTEKDIEEIVENISKHVRNELKNFGFSIFESLKDSAMKKLLA